MRPALAILVILPALAIGQQVKEGEEDKVSNDNPGRPFQMPPASTEVKEAIEDFERFQRRGAWERALKSLYTIPDEQVERFIDGENGFIIPIARKRRLALAALPPNGQAACRLFHDADARKLLEEAEGPAELKNLERIYSAYFITSVGDNAADRLGDAYFELGRFDRAADCWLAVLRERPDTDLSPALLSVKAALALSRAGRHAEFTQLRSELAERYSDEKVTLAGVNATPGALLQRLLDGDSTSTDATSSSTPTPDVGLDLTKPVDAIWRVRFADSIEAGMTPPELSQWQSSALSAAVPAVANDGTTLYVNYLGHMFAVDTKSGKMLWRSASFHHLEMFAMQNMAQMVDPSRFAIVASGPYVWTIARDLKDQNFLAPFRLTCRRADRGEVVWQSTDLTDYAQLDLVGPPLLVAGKMFIAAKSQMNPQQQQQPPQQFLLAIQPHDGKVLWKREVGTFRQGNFGYFFFYNSRDPSPQPRLVYRAGSVYLDTQVGVLARLDADSGALDWGYGYRTDNIQSAYRFFWYYEPQEQTTVSSAPTQSGDAFLVKGAKSDRLYAVEPNRMKVLWERPIAKSSRLLGVGERALFLGGPELSAVDLRSRELLWATPLPNGSTDERVLVRPDGLWQLTARGIFEIDPQSGGVRRIFRGSDLGAVGGDLLLTNDLLLAVSNRSISAYPRKIGGTSAPKSAHAAASMKRAFDD